MEYLSFKGFKGYEIITSYRKGGVSEGNYASLNLSFDVKDKKENVYENRNRFFKAINLNQENIVEINPKNCPVLPIKCSNDKDVAIAITHSDSLSLFFVVENKKIFGALQVTTKMLLEGMLEKSIRAFMKEQNVKSNDIKIYFAPSLAFTNNEICKIKANKLIKNGYADVVKRINNLYYFDEQELAIKRLRKVGILMKNMAFASLNTYEDNDLLFSKKRKTPTGKMMSVIRVIK